MEFFEIRGKCGPFTSASLRTCFSPLEIISIVLLSYVIIIAVKKKEYKRDIKGKRQERRGRHRRRK
jgi:hypothetical protein